MNSTVTIPASAAIAIADMPDNAAQIEPGQQVVIVAARDGLYGDFNLVDECVIDLTEAAAAGRGADISVVWMDVRARPAVLWVRARTWERHSASRAGQGRPGGGRCDHRPRLRPLL